jgi:autotransporter-associated beta strand protein
MTVNGIDWAADVGGGVVGAASHDTDFTNPASNIDMTSGMTNPALPFTVNTLRFNDSAIAGTTLTLPAGTNIVSVGGVLIGSGATSVVIEGGALAGAAGQELVVVQNNVSSAALISAPIVDNTSATGLSKFGPGMLILTGANTYTGATSVVGGTLQMGVPNVIPTSGLTVSAGATLDLAGNSNQIANQSFGRSLQQGTIRLAYDPVTAKARLWLDAAELGQHAVAARHAFLGPDGLLLQDAQELRVEGRVHGLAGEALGQGLHARAAGEGEDGPVPLDRLRQVLDKLVLALPLDGHLFDLDGLALQATGHADRVGRDAHLPLPARRIRLGAHAQHDRTFQKVPTVHPSLLVTSRRRTPCALGRTGIRNSTTDSGFRSTGPAIPVKAMIAILGLV